MDSKEKLIEATRALLWERGYDATSPRAILAASGAGQGSMYHHFRGKEALALAAVQRNCEEQRAQIDDDLATGTTALEQIAGYLERERDVLMGCRFGKLTQDPEVIASEPLRGEVGGFFDWLRARLEQVLATGTEAGEFPDDMDVANVAAAVAAGLQGAYVLARAAQDPRAFDAAVAGMLELLAAARATV